MEYQIFGSRSSIDIDVMVFLDELPKTIMECHTLIKELNKSLFDNSTSHYFKSNKTVNANLAILENGVLKEVFKGTVDECNNSLFLTYDLHLQDYPNQIINLVERDVDLKLIRFTRFLLSFISRNEFFRFEIKLALMSGDIRIRLKVLEKFTNIVFLSDAELIQKKLTWSDFAKVVAFQLGQTHALLNGKELYTKEDISDCYPTLEPYLMRSVLKNDNHENINNFYNNLRLDLKDNLPKMKKYIE